MQRSALKKAHDLMLPAIREAAAAVMRFYKSSNYEVMHKDPENPVTEADFAANRILRAAIEQNFPDDAILSEESDSAEERASMDDRFHRARTWILDPIDGTREFIKGRDEFAISAGLVVAGKAVLGFICNPARNYLLSGGPGLGLYLDGQLFAHQSRGGHAWPASDQPRYPEIVVSRSEFKSGKLAHLVSYYPDLEKRAVGSIAYKLALVADGTYDLVVSVKPKNEWDIAGGAALMNAAGLELFEGNGSAVVFNKRNTESFGLVGGTQNACRWYQSLAAK